MTLLLAVAVAILATMTIRGALEPSPWQRVYATREGEVGKKTATGLRITSDSRFVALPHPAALGKHVEVRYRQRAVVVPVLDVGPWNIDDAYWTNDRRPAAERNQGHFRAPSNRAGIDLSDPVFSALGLRDNDWVEWRFVHKGYLVLPWL
ncbi:MAG: hypothetical protein JWN44_4665 [Myxococcales bacterium]|nr:hypothetical protein [Myxococcales bacterium]